MDDFRITGWSGRVIASALLALSLPFAVAKDAPDLSALTFVPVALSETARAAEGPAAAASARSGPAAAPMPGTRLSIEQYRRRIRETEDRFGPYHPSLSEDSLALARLYQSEGRHQEAVAAFERAFHVTRVNGGLFDIRQHIILRGMIDSYIALEEFAKADEKQQYLFYLYRRNYRNDETAMLPAMIEWADWNVNLHLRESAAAPPLYPDERGLGRGVLPPRLALAQDLYYGVLETLARSADLQDPRLVSTERKLAALHYVVDRERTRQLAFTLAMAGGYDPLRQDLDQGASAHFYNGSDALKRAIAWSSNAPNPESGDIAERILELGDWYLLFDRRDAALETYEEAFAVLRAASLPEQEIERIMTPGMPVQVPAIPAPPAEGIPADYKGYIDVEFRLSKFGMASRPQIISAPAVEGAYEDIEKELLRTIRSCKFRPKFVGGAVASEETVRLRYYYTY